MRNTQYRVHSTLCVWVSFFSVSSIYFVKSIYYYFCVQVDFFELLVSNSLFCCCCLSSFIFSSFVHIHMYVILYHYHHRIGFLFGSNGSKKEVFVLLLGLEVECGKKTQISRNDNGHGKQPDDDFDENLVGNCKFVSFKLFFYYYLMLLHLNCINHRTHSTHAERTIILFLFFSRIDLSILFFIILIPF